MAGHSHWHNIKRKKEVEDKKRAKIFARLSREIMTSVKKGGKDPESNPTLRTAIAKAKEEDMPKENIEKAIEKGAGEGAGESLEEFTLEAYGPDGIAIIIKGSSDNKNRSLSEINQILKKYNGKLSEPGSVKWMFKEVGIIEVAKEENSEINAIEAGAEDISLKEESILIYTSPKELNEIEERIKGEIISSEIGFKAKDTLDLRKQDYENFLEDLEESDSVEKIYTNINS